MIEKKKGSAQHMAMAFRIERLVSGEDLVVLRVSGRIHAEHVDMLRELLGLEEVKVLVDLREVTLVDREAVSFLALSEAQGVELRNCAAIYGSGSTGRGLVMTRIERTQRREEGATSEIFDPELVPRKSP